MTNEELQTKKEALGDESGLKGETVLIDEAEALNRVRGNKTLYAKLLKMYLGSDQFELFKSSLEKGDLEAARLHIHSIKGISSNLSLTALYKESSALNEQLKLAVPTINDLGRYYETESATRKAVEDFLSCDS